MRLILQFILGSFLSLIVVYGGICQNQQTISLDNFNVQELIQQAEKYHFNPEKVIHITEKALQKLEKGKNKEVEAKVYLLQGKAHYALNQTNQAIEDYKNSASIYLEIRDTVSYSNVLDKIGVCYQMKSQYSQALEYHQKAYNYAERTNDTKLKASSQNNLGIVYQLTNQFDKSLLALNKAIELFSTIDNKLGLSSTQNNLGLTYSLLGKYDEALSWFLTAISTKQEIRDTLNLANTYESVGQLYEKTDNKAKSIEYYTEALRLHEILKNKRGISDDLTSLARVYLNAKNYPKAYDNLVRSDEIANEIENYLAIKENKKLLSEYYLAIGNPYQSREMMQQYAVVVEKLFNRQISNRIAEITVQFETDQKDYQNKLLQANLEIEQVKLQKSRYIQFFSIFIALVLTIAFIYLLVFLRRLHKKREEIEKINNNLNSLNLELEKKVEERTIELKEALLKAEESDNLKSAFLANMSHEIRTPMNGIVGFAKILEDDSLAPELRKKYVDILGRQSQSLLQIVNDLITISKIESGQVTVKKSIININSFLSDIYNQFKLKLIQGKFDEIEIRIVKPLSDELAFILTDPARLEQIISSLLDNALKFTAKGFIELGYRIDAPRTIELYVKDSGIGIPEYQHDKIFTKFYRYSRNNQPLSSGTGLGLSIAENLTKMLGGEINFESKEGEGSTFFVRIPYVPIEQSLTERKNIVKPTSDWSNKMILIVEDDLISYLFLESILNKTKANIIHVKNGEDAIEVCHINEKIDLILMDMQLPFISGYEATRVIKSFRTNIPIIAQTANVLNNEKERCLKTGCDEYISKPIDPDEFMSMLKKFLN